MKIKYRMTFIAIIIGILLIDTACDTGSSIEVDPSTDDPNGGETIHTHTWGEWGNSTATCTTVGVETRTCSLDSTHIETRQIAAPGHSFVDSECTVCGEKEGEVDITGLSVNAIKTAIETRLTAGNDVTVTGTASVTEALTLAIPAGRTVIWNANYTSSGVNDTITLNGAGNFILTGKLEKNTPTGPGAVLLASSSFTGKITLSAGGEITTDDDEIRTSYGIRIESTATLVVNGGTIAMRSRDASNHAIITATGTTAKVFIMSGTVSKAAGPGSPAILIHSGYLIISGGTITGAATGTPANIATIGNSTQTAGVYVSGNPNIPDGRIIRASYAGTGTAYAYYTGNHAAKFASSFTAAYLSAVDTPPDWAVLD